MQRLLSLWNWLPTFRAVAEQQHVSRAAEELGVSPSAVSRMIGLLEGDVGQPLFNRVGRQIELNEAGLRLLTGLRSAMRLVDESLSAVADAQFVGEVRIATAEPVTRLLLLPALEQLRPDHPQLRPVLQPSPADAGAALLRGDLDVALVWQVAELDQVSVERIGSLRLRVYAQVGHPLLQQKARRHAFTQVAEHPFVLNPLDAAGLGWPRQHRRAVALNVPSVTLAAELCAKGQGLALLPEMLVEREMPALRGQLAPLRLPGVTDLEAFAQWRVRLGLPGRAEAVVAAVQRQMKLLMA